MAIEDTYSCAKTPAGREEHFWTQEDAHASTTLQVHDEADSVTVHIQGDTKGTSAPGISASMAVRITYSDAALLIGRLQEMLTARAQS